MPERPRPPHDLAITHLESLAGAISASLDTLAAGITACATDYAAADGNATHLLDLRMAWEL